MAITTLADVGSNARGGDVSVGPRHTVVVSFANIAVNGARTRRSKVRSIAESLPLQEAFVSLTNTLAARLLERSRHGMVSLFTFAGEYGVMPLLRPEIEWPGAIWLVWLAGSPNQGTAVIALLLLLFPGGQLLSHRWRLTAWLAVVTSGSGRIEPVCRTPAATAHRESSGTIRPDLTPGRDLPGDGMLDATIRRGHGREGLKVLHQLLVNNVIRGVRRPADCRLALASGGNCVRRARPAAST
jgi:hypothetical protein